jgi:hypothetical protein
MHRPLALLAAAIFSLPPGSALAGADDDGPKPADLAKAADALAPSLVRVEYTPQYDKGESPGGNSWYPPPWAYSSTTTLGPERSDNWDQLIREERPAEYGGYLISPTRIYTADPMVHPRFIKSIKIRFKDQVADAHPATYPRTNAGYFLDLDAPLKGATPLSFDAAAPGPYFVASYQRRDATWAVGVSGMRSSTVVTDDGRRSAPNATGSVIITKDGKAVALAGVSDLPVDDSWKTAPDRWPAVSASEMDALQQTISTAADAALLRITINLRSPRSASEGMGRYQRYMRPDQEDTLTEWNGAGVLLDPQTVLVLANLRPKVTGRIDRIRVFTADNRELPAAFDGTLKDWGGLLARLEKPATNPIRPSSQPITGTRDRLLIKAEISVRGDTRTAYYSRERISSFFPGYKGQIFPQVSAGGGRSGRPYGYDAGESALHFLYDLDGSLVAIPVERREKVAADERYSYAYGGGQDLMVPTSVIMGLLKDRKAATDPENKPLSEDEENRLAWLGTELQGMDPELARANNVMEQTRNGMTGALVTYIYENSPASKANLQVGDILLRLHVEGQPKPLDVQVEGGDHEAMFDGFWGAMDQIPDEYFDQMPKPWGSAENALTRALTDIGFGTPFSAEVFRDGRIIPIPFHIEQGPPHYDAAKRFKSEAGGLTVRDLTYEVRRYFQLKPDDPGVIISKVERGGKAAVAGLKPFELITAVNDESITTADGFNKAIAAGGEFRLSVKRMTVGRIVKVRIPAAGSPEAKEAAERARQAEQPGEGAPAGPPK